MAADRGVQLDGLADESLVAAMAFLSAGSVAALAAAASRFIPPARADLLWLPLAARRWRFGAVPTSKESLLPGAREIAAESAYAMAALAPLQREARVFDFYARRGQQDTDVALLALQMNEAFLHPDPVPPPGAEELQPGTVVRLVNLASMPKYNGALGVVGQVVPAGNEQRFAVSLPMATKPISVRSLNMAYRHTRITEEEAERRILEHGASGLDALARFAKVLESVPGSPLAVNTRHLLSRVSEQWSEQQWSLLLADPGRTDLLEEGGLIVSQWAEPGEADVSQVRAILANLASAVEARTSAKAPIMERVEAVNAVLFDEWGLKGDMENYYNPQNSLLHAVLARRCGIPISLSIVWVAVARRVHVPCFLLAGMPSHLLIRVTTDGGGLRDDIFVDAFNRRIMDFTQFRQFAAGVAGSFDEEFAAQHPPTAVYARLLRNLRGIFQEHCQRRDFSVLQRLAAHEHLGGVCSQILTIAPRCTEADQVRLLREQVREVLARNRRRAHV